MFVIQNKVTGTALNVTPRLQVMEELDTLPTTEKLCKAIDCLTSAKVRRNDSIPPEVLKSGKSELPPNLGGPCAFAERKGRFCNARAMPELSRHL